MKKINKAGIILVSFTVMLSMTSCANVNKAKGENDQQNNIVEPSQNPNENNKVPGLVISGIVRYNELESGFYELDGYRLTGEQDFSKYEGKIAVATGELDDSPSIYMVKLINIRDIVAKEDSDFVDRMEELIDEYSTALKKAETAGEGMEVTGLISNNLAMLQQILSKNTDESNLGNRTDVNEGIGKYGGQADNNFIEIEINNATNGETSRIFQLSDELKDKFIELELKTGEAIQFKYQERENQNPEILEIQKIK